MAHKPFDEMSDDEFAEAIIPTESDMASAGAFVAAQSRLDPVELLYIYNIACEEGRGFQMLSALAETCLRAMALRDDPDALERLHTDIAAHRLAATQSTDEEGDTNA